MSTPLRRVSIFSQGMFMAPIPALILTQTSQESTTTIAKELQTSGGLK